MQFEMTRKKENTERDYTEEEKKDREKEFLYFHCYIVVIYFISTIRQFRHDKIIFFHCK